VTLVIVVQNTVLAERLRLTVVQTVTVTAPQLLTVANREVKPQPTAPKVTAAVSIRPIQAIIVRPIPIRRMPVVLQVVIVNVTDTYTLQALPQVLPPPRHQHNPLPRSRDVSWVVLTPVLPVIVALRADIVERRLRTAAADVFRTVQPRKWDAKQAV